MHAVTDYTMARRSVLSELRGGALSRADVCDAQPELLRVATHQGIPTGDPCPVCESAECVVVSFAFGERLARRNGRMVEPAEIPEYVAIDGVRCYSVEVCTECSWNHILRAYFGVSDADIGDNDIGDDRARRDLASAHLSRVEATADLDGASPGTSRRAGSDRPRVE